MLTFIEWAEFAHDEIPQEALKINVEYDENDVDIRTFEFEATNKDTQEFLNRFLHEVKK